MGVVTALLWQDRDMRLFQSISGRLLVTGSLVLTAFLGVTGLILDSLFCHSIEAATKQRLKTATYLLMSAAELGGEKGVVLPAILPEARFSTLKSGLYAQVSNNAGNGLWRSPSMSILSIPFHEGLKPLEQRFKRAVASNGQELFVFSFGLTLQGNAGPEKQYTFSVAESLDSYKKQVAEFRRNLAISLGTVAILLLITQWLVLRWGLIPLRRAADGLTAIEAGEKTHLQGKYPKELRGLTNNINALISSEREHIKRYRDALGDLAHSMKTPLAILQGYMEKSEGKRPRDELLSEAKEQVVRMTQIVEYQLQRAATSGRIALAKPVYLAPLVKKVIAALYKVYAEKSVKVEVELDEEMSYHGDEGDLMEIVGNLLDNAFKWCNSSVVISVKHDITGDGDIAGINIVVWDDGPGIPKEQKEQVLQRGARADVGTVGHGIGLAIVDTIAQLYGGQVKIETGPLGGAMVSVYLEGS